MSRGGVAVARSSPCCRWTVMIELWNALTLFDNYSVDILKYWLHTVFAPIHQTDFRSYQPTNFETYFLSNLGSASAFIGVNVA